MRKPGELLDLPAEQGARWLALGFVEESRLAHARMEQGEDPEALHDFRVGLRRLRSTLRAYEPELRGSIGDKDRRRVRALARATGGARDAEVHLEWLERQAGHAGAEHRPGVEHMLARVRAEKEDADRELRREVAKDFARERRRLVERLSRLRLEVPLAEASGGPTLAAAVARLAGVMSAELQGELARVGNLGDQERAHEARIRAKRLRYLLEPFERDLPGAAAVVKRIKKLQDLLGEMHDAHVLLAAVAVALEEVGPAPLPAPDGDGGEPAGEPAPHPQAGLEWLAGRLVDERAARFRELERRWLGRRSDDFFRQVEAVARAAAERGRADVEIERKFLLRRMPQLPRDAAVEVQRIDQGYLPGEKLAERVRRVRSDAGTRWYRTVKLGTGMSRLEVEEETTEDVFRRLWALTKGRRINKVRYRVPDGALTWEIDRFRALKLVVAEVEIPSEDTRVAAPQWLSRWIVQEVTGDPRYLNLNLAR